MSRIDAKASRPSVERAGLSKGPVPKQVDDLLSCRPSKSPFTGCSANPKPRVKRHPLVQFSMSADTAQGQTGWRSVDSLFANAEESGASVARSPCNPQLVLPPQDQASQQRLPDLLEILWAITTLTES
jgi:hypothetical protein